MTSLASPLGSIRGVLSRLEDSRWGVLVPMAVAAVMGLIGLGDKSMWLDEAYSASMIRLPTADLLAYMWRHEQDASPHYLLLHAWSALGFGEFTLRLPSVVSGVVAVAATYAVARRFGVGLLAALLLAVAPFFIHYEQEARVYTLLVAWSAICTLAYLRLIDRPNRWRGAAYVVSAAILVYVHPLSATLLVAHALVTLTTVAPPMRWRLLALYAPVLIAALPMVRFLVLNHSRVAWIPPVTPDGVARATLALSGGIALALGLAVVIAAGLWRARSSAWSTLRLPLLWIVLVPGGVLAVSVAIQPLWVDRYLIGVLPALFIIAAWAIKSLPHRWAIAGMLVALSLVGVNTWYDAAKDDWRAAAAYVATRAQPSDAVLVWPAHNRMPFGYYYAAAGEPVYPSTPWQEAYLPFYSAGSDLPADMDNERIWLVRTVTFFPTPELAALLEPYDTVATSVFGATQPQVDLLVRRP
jgi:mannosyltransferase